MINSYFKRLKKEDVYFAHNFFVLYLFESLFVRKTIPVG